MDRRRFLVTSLALATSPGVIERRQLLHQLLSLPLLPAVAAAADGRRAPIGILTGFTLPPSYRAAFEDGVRAGGFAPAIDERSAGGHIERLPEMARALVGTDVRLVVALEIFAIACPGQKPPR